MYQLGLTALGGALLLFGTLAALSLPSATLADACSGPSDPICAATSTSRCVRSGYCVFTNPFITVTPCCYQTETSTTYEYYTAAL